MGSASLLLYFKSYVSQFRQVANLNAIEAKIMIPSPFLKLILNCLATSEKASEFDREYYRILEKILDSGNVDRFKILR